MRWQLGRNTYLSIPDFIDFVSYRCDENAGDRGEEIEEAIRQVGERGNVEHCRLRHAAGAPRDEHGGDGA